MNNVTTMPDELMTIQQISRESGLSVFTVRNYLHKIEPRLPIAQRIEVNGHLENRVMRRDFEAWLTEYRSKPLFGGALHKNRKSNKK